MPEMFDVDFVIRNYRGFGDEPARFRLKDGFTALIGTNGSGKTSLLRMLYELRPLLLALADRAMSDEGFLLDEDLLWQPSILSGERIVRVSTARNAEIDIVVRDGPWGRPVANGEQVVLKITYAPSGETTAQLFTAAGDSMSGFTDAEKAEMLTPLKAAMRALADAMYVGPFRNAINVGAQQQYYDIQTGDAFVRAFAEYKSGDNPRHNENVAELLEQLRRIFGFRSLDINATPDYKALQLTVDGRSFRLTEQGAGLAHFIVVLVNTMVKRPSFLLIDEPELNLHASLQLDFLSTLASYTKYGVVFATHSLGLARTAADRIYTLAKPPGGTIHLAPYEEGRDLAPMLGQLAFDRRPDLGFNRVLLVEGKSELRAVGRLLRLYGKEHEILLLPLHGSDMIGPDVEPELSELGRLGGDVKYLIDSERTSQGAPLDARRQGFVDVCARLAITGCVLERRALENYLPEHAVRRAFGDKVSALGPFEKKGAAQGWPKTANWRAAAEMTRADLDSTDLGKFLESA